MSKRKCFDTDLKEVMSSGGLIKVNGVSVIFNNPDNLNYYGSLTGYYIRNAQDWMVYFKCRDRRKAQETADILFGSGQYTIQSKI